MNIELFRVDLAFTHPVEQPWAGFALQEQRNPPAGDGWQLWATNRLNESRGSRILDGQPITPVFATADDLAQHITDNADVCTPAPGFFDAHEFVHEVEFAPTASRTRSGDIRGIVGAVIAWRERGGRK